MSFLKYTILKIYVFFPQFCHMNIGFDAKRAYHNTTGLGVFSRVLIKLLITHYPENEYFLYNPKPGKLFRERMNVHEILPQHIIHKKLSAVWRSKWVINTLKKHKIDVYHGLSHEIPFGLHRAGMHSVVSMHDMFPETHPDQYKSIDVRIYRTKTRYACNYADRIMAISEETKRHIIEIYEIDPSKIEVIHQSVDPLFMIKQTAQQKQIVRAKYNLPKEFFLHVGTIIERKNLLNICKAMMLLGREINIPLVVVGKGTVYKEKVKDFIAKNDLQDKIIFLSDAIKTQGKNFIDTQDFPALYQMSTAMIYPSYYEGFGLPIIEAMAGGVPVVTSNTSCMPEIGGDAAYYVNPNSPEEMAAGLKKVYDDPVYADMLFKKGIENANRFTPEKYVHKVMSMYHAVTGK